MNSSLISKFQGGLIGSIVGLTLAGNPYRQKRLAWENLPRKYWQILAQAIDLQMCAERNYDIISSQINPDNWLQTGKNWQINPQSTVIMDNFLLILSCLPIAFFYHENFNLLRVEIKKIITIRQDLSELENDILLLCRVISLVLQEQLNPNQIFAQIISFPEADRTFYQEKLNQLQIAIDRGMGLKQVMSLFTDRANSIKLDFTESIRSAIFLSLYCFCCTPDDLKLSILRAMNTNDEDSVSQPLINNRNKTIAAFTGAISGAYNSINNFPISWRCQIKNDPIVSSLNQKIQLLYLSWSGVYAPDRYLIDDNFLTAAASAIQPRPSLKIISQQE